MGLLSLTGRRSDPGDARPGLRWASSDSAIVSVALKVHSRCTEAGTGSGRKCFAIRIQSHILRAARPSATIQGKSAWRSVLRNALKTCSNGGSDHGVGEAGGPQRLSSRFFPRNCRLESLARFARNPICRRSQESRTRRRGPGGRRCKELRKLSRFSTGPDGLSCRRVSLSAVTDSPKLLNYIPLLHLQTGGSVSFAHRPSQNVGVTLPASDR
jgi:hypothetical protein